MACACARKYTDVMCLVLVGLGSRHSKHLLFLRRSVPIPQSFASFCIHKGSMLPPRPAYCNFEGIGLHTNHTLNRAKLGANQDTLSISTYSLDVQTHQMVFVLQVHHSRLLYLAGPRYTQNMKVLGAHVENSKYKVLL